MIEPLPQHLHDFINSITCDMDKGEKIGWYQSLRSAYPQFDAQIVEIAGSRDDIEFEDVTPTKPKRGRKHSA